MTSSVVSPKSTVVRSVADLSFSFLCIESTTHRNKWSWSHNRRRN